MKTVLYDSDDFLCEEDTAVQEYAWDFLKQYIDDLFDCKTCVFIGTIGRWNGIASGCDVGDFWKVFDYVFKDCEFFRFVAGGERLYISGAHHDGSVSVEVKTLTDKGVDFYENWIGGYDYEDMPESEFVKRLCTDCRLSVLPFNG